jgi:hypothetical protein
MAPTSLFQAGTAVLVLVALLQFMLYLWNRSRALEEARREGPLHDLESGRRLLRLAEGRRARGSYEAAVRICERARAVLSEARRRAGESGDRKTAALAGPELARCAAIADDSVRRLRGNGSKAGRPADGRLAAQRLVHIDMLLDEAESLGIDAEEAFAAGNFIDARDRYITIKAKLDEARRAAVETGSRAYVRLIDGELGQAQRGLSSANAWVLDGRPVFETPRPGQVRGVISPYFRREDGSRAPRPR